MNTESPATSHSIHPKLASAGLIAAGVLMAASAQHAAAQSTVDAALSAEIDRLGDVVKRIDFDHRRLSEVDHWGDWDRISALDLCGSLAATVTWNVPAKIAVGFGGGLTVDGSFMQSFDMFLKTDNSVSAKAAASLYGTGYLFACINLKPWLLAAWYRYYENTPPPLEAFTYAEYEGSGTPTSDSLTMISDAFESSGELRNIDDDTRTFLNTAMKVAFGSSGAPDDLESTPIYQHYISPVNDFFTAIENGVSGGADAVLGSDAMAALKLAFSRAAQVQTPNDMLYTFTTLAGNVDDVLPFDLGIGALGETMREISADDFDPCALSESSLYEATHLPAFIADGLESFCGGVEKYAHVSYDAVVRFVDWLPDKTDIQTVHDAVEAMRSWSIPVALSDVVADVESTMSLVYDDVISFTRLVEWGFPDL